jgi:putative ABC transport system ATP-binding protein
MSTQPLSSKVNMDTAIICRDIHKTYGQGEARVHALRGVSLNINQGELRLLMGPSGSGKTTLISIIAGILTQDSGECIVKGVNLAHLPDKEKTRFRGQNIGFVFQVFNLIPMITIEENVSIPLLLGGILRQEALERSKQVLIELDMGDKIGKHPPELSGGQQQRVAIARAIVHSPHFIVCDEPTSFLDLHTGIKIMEQLQHLVRKNGVTIVVVTHDPRIVSFADKIDYLEDGKIVEKSS